MKSVPALRWHFTHFNRQERERCSNTSFKSPAPVWFLFHMVCYFFYFFILFYFASSFLMSVFIRHVTVWSRAPSDRYLYTPLHIMEPAPSVLNFSLSSLLQTVAESVSVQFVEHLKWCFPAFCQCSISSSQRRSCAPVFWRPLGCLSCVLSSPFIHLNFIPFSVCLQLNSRCKSTQRTAACLHILFLSVSVFFGFF